MVTVVAFGFAWWLGLYLLARDPAKPTLRRAGAGLLAYALALATDGVLDHRVHTVLLCLPAILWTGVLVAHHPADRWWRGAILPATVAAAVGSVIAAVPTAVKSASDQARSVRLCTDSQPSSPPAPHSGASTWARTP